MMTNKPLDCTGTAGPVGKCDSVGDPHVKLMTCPFCPDGGDPHHVYKGVRCDRCGVTLNDWDIGETGAERWNTRATPHAEAVRVLVKALRFYQKHAAQNSLDGVEGQPTRFPADKALSHPAVVSALSSAEGVK
jgi:hypothetical protein